MGNILNHLPNILTTLRLFIAAGIVYFRLLGVDGTFLACGVALGLFTDFLDGYVARKRNLSTQFGKQYDHYVDKIFILTLFILIGISRFPLESFIDWSIVICLVVLTIRDVYIGYFKTIHTTLPSLQSAKRKTTMQGGAIIAYFLGLVPFSGMIFMVAVGFSLWSGRGYIRLSKGLSQSINKEKIQSFFAVFQGKRRRTYKLHKVPSVKECKRLFSEGLETVIFDIDGTLVPFGKELSSSTQDLLRSYNEQGIRTILYTNSSNKQRSERIADEGINIYLGNHAKPSNKGYEEIAQQWNIDLKKTIMIGDSPITDNPENGRILLGSILVKPLQPKGGFGPWVHYIFNLFLGRFAKILGE